MEKFKRTFSVRRRKDPLPESSKPHQWQEDERKVREGTCSFHVKYLGCVEVFESRGIQICEEAVKALKSRKSRSVWSRMSLRKKRGDNQSSKSGHHHAMLYVTGDALRVVDDISKGLIVDQTIEKVSFCAPDRNYEKGFAYICRDGTTRRWMCHGFLAIKESGERLSHAVGCAFAVCLEKKQQREKEKVTVMFNENGTSFTRMGSFRPTTLSERLTDPQSAIVAEPVPVKKAENTFAVQRPHASVDLLERQGSFRGFDKLSDSSPFKRNLSLRLNELPSTLDRQRQGMGGIIGPHDASFNAPVISTIMEAEETNDSGLANDLSSLHINSNNNGSSVTATRPYQAFPAAAGNTAGENNNSIFSAQNQSARLMSYQQQQLQQPQYMQQQTMLEAQAGVMQPAGGFNQQLLYQQQTAARAYGTVAMPYQQQQPISLFNGAGLPPLQPPSVSSNIPQASAAPGPNPWGAQSPPTVTEISSLQQKSGRSEAESWLSATANFIDPFAGVPVTSQSNRTTVRGYNPVNTGPAPHSASNQVGISTAAVTVHAVPSSVGNTGQVGNGNNGQAGGMGNTVWQQPATDQFDAVWASKAPSGAVVNPFQSNTAQGMHNGASIMVNQQPTFQFTI